MRDILQQMEHIKRMVVNLEVKPQSLPAKSNLIKNMGRMQVQLKELVSVVVQLNQKRKQQEKKGAKKYTMEEAKEFFTKLYKEDQK